MAKKVKIVLKGGKESFVDARFAKALVHAGKAIYLPDYEQKVITANDKEVKAKKPANAKKPAAVEGEESKVRKPRAKKVDNAE